jgi:putative spermidine/putrescine transport system substrate-binding protein
MFKKYLPILLITIFVMSVLLSSAVMAKETLVISTWGYNEDLLWKNLYKPFEEKYDCEIQLEVGNNSTRLNKVKMRQGSTVDVIYLAESYALDAIISGMIAELNRDNIPNIEELYPVAKAPHGEQYGPAYTLVKLGIIYDQNSVDEPIESWFDLWDESFEDNVSIPDFNTTAGPAMLIMAAEKAGVELAENPDQAFAELEKMKENVVKNYSRSSDVANMFAQGEIAAAPAMDFAFFRVKDAVDGAVWLNPKEGSFANFNTLNIVKGSDNKELAEKFINYAISEEVQTKMAMDKVESPLNMEVELTAAEAEGLTYGADLINSLNTIDWNLINENKEAWLQRWNRMFAY